MGFMHACFLNAKSMVTMPKKELVKLGQIGKFRQVIIEKEPSEAHQTQPKYSQQMSEDTIIDEKGVEMDSTTAFVDSAHIVFCGESLNTAPSRFIFVQSLGLKLFEQETIGDALSYPGMFDDAFKIVFRLSCGGWRYTTLET